MTIGVLILLVILVVIFFPQIKEAFKTDTSARLNEEVLADIAEMATVTDKQVSESGIRRNRYIDYSVVFETDDGKTLEFSLRKEVFEEIEIGERDMLVYQEARFIGFGDHAAVQADAVPEASREDGTFFYDDYDETIDVELVPDSEENPASGALSGEEKELLAQWNDRIRLPQKISAAEAETEDLYAYSAVKLLERTDTYRFLKNDPQIGSLFTKVYAAALRELEGFAGDTRGGRAADSVFISKSEFSLLISLQENTAPLLHKITAEFCVNP